MIRATHVQSLQKKLLTGSTYPTHGVSWTVPWGKMNH